MFFFKATYPQAQMSFLSFELKIYEKMDMCGKVWIG